MTPSGLAVLVAVFLSNLPESVAATVGLRTRGWRPAPTIGLWTAVTLASATAALAGFSLLDGAAAGVVAFVNAFAGGAIVTCWPTPWHRRRTRTAADRLASPPPSAS